MAEWIREACRYVSASLSGLADREKAEGMQRYMKTDMPFYGVQKPGRTPLLKHVVASYPPSTWSEYQQLVLALWNLPHREEKYIAQGVALAHRQFLVPRSLPLYRTFIVEGAWWDFVDEAATHMVRQLALDHPGETWPEVDRWIDDDDMWLRRSAIICQVGAKDRTDTDRLFSFCERRSFEKEFFIRKAIGWALREYSKTDPTAVAAFVTEHRAQLAPLSFREATKHIGDLVGP